MLTPEEISEVEKHKYFLSEKAGHDVGWEYAEQDWRTRYAAVSPPPAPASTANSPAGSRGGLGGLLKRWWSRSKAAM
jgi:hypothetical protein